MRNGPGQSRGSLRWLRWLFRTKEREEYGFECFKPRGKKEKVTVQKKEGKGRSRFVHDSVTQVLANRMLPCNGDLRLKALALRDYVWVITNISIILLPQMRIRWIRFKLDSKENPFLFEKYSTLPWGPKLNMVSGRCFILLIPHCHESYNILRKINIIPVESQG